MDGIKMNRLRFMAGKGKGVREELASYFEASPRLAC